MNLRYASLFGSLVASTLCLTGCGGTTGPATVEGTVSIKGTKLNHGTVKITGADGKFKTSPISPAGTYQVNDAPTGDVAVTVEAEKSLKGMPTKTAPTGKTAKVELPPAGDATAPVPIPAMYSLTANAKKVHVNAGSRQTINIDFE